MRTIQLMAAGATLFLCAAPASAALMQESCYGGSADDLSPSVQCAYVYDDSKPTGTANDSESGLNNLGIFGYSSWEILGKFEQSGSSFVDDGDTTNLIDLDVNNTGGGLVEGTWSFDPAAWNSFNPISLVLKDGNNAPTPPQSASGGFYIYLLEPVTSSGIWNTFDTFEGAALSHLSAYGITGSHNVPEPSILALLGLGLLGLFGVRRRC